MLDRYWYGKVDRISPEAPVPVVAIQGDDERLGGAANVARNVKALGADASLLSVCGDDEAADTLTSLLGEEQIGAHLRRDPLINTIIKLRVIAQQQQVVRIDFESPVSKDTSIKLLEKYKAQFEGYQAVIISDYDKGSLQHIGEMIELARNKDIPVIVDPKGADFTKYKNATALTPNRKEFEKVAGKCLTEKDFSIKAKELSDSLNLGGLLVTRGAEGMNWYGQDGSEHHLPAHAKEVFDVTGAGDTVIAALGTSLASGLSMLEAMDVANRAAAVVVGKLGAETAGPDEIADVV